MDQMKENYLTHMNLVLTHFCPNVVLYGCCSQGLIYIYIYLSYDKLFNLISCERHTTRELKKYPSRVVAYPSLDDFEPYVVGCC